MSEGERVERWVYERMPEGEVPGVWTYLGAEFICDSRNTNVFYRRIPDPVPALEARIAELEGVIRVAGAAIKDLQDELYENHVRNRRVPKYITDLYDNATAASERIESALKPPTPAAAKET